MGEILTKIMFPNENLELSWKTWKVAFTKFKMYFSASHLELFKIEADFLIHGISILLNNLIWNRNSFDEFI